MSTEIRRNNWQPQHCGTPQPSCRASSSPATPRTPAVRSYFRSLRAAETAAWENTGGDFVLARFATQQFAS